MNRLFEAKTMKMGFKSSSSIQSANFFLKFFGFVYMRGQSKSAKITIFSPSALREKVRRYVFIPAYFFLTVYIPNPKLF